MIYHCVLVGLSVLSGTLASWSADLAFPAGFKFGAATAAAQTEGAWNVSDKTQSIWDVFVRERPGDVAGRATNELACDSYHLWRRDIEIAAEMGLDMYRFSISWPRLLPNGFANHISADGGAHYGDLIDGLLERGIEPVVTMYHFDLPQNLQDLGGWANPLIVDWFGDYSRVLYSLYGDRVKTWITINEPLVICDAGFSNITPPGLDDEVGQALCTKNVVMAHATAWRIYDEEFKSKYHGRVSITSLFFWFEPAAPEDAELADLVREYCESRFGHPIFSKEGGWPPKLKAVLDEYSKRVRSPLPKLPDFTPEEIDFVKGTYDFYGLNHYTTRMVRKVRPGDAVGRWPFDGPPELGAVLGNNPQWKNADAPWFSIYPEGLRRQISWLRSRYGDVEVVITETGYASSSKDLDDQKRVEYMRDYMIQMLKSINEDGANVTAYIVWSLIDSFEWIAGYGNNYGLYNVDFSSPSRDRTARASAKFFSDVIATKQLRYPDHVENNLV